MPQRASPQTLRRLTYFAAIADAGSIREAARRLGLSVASVSESLAALEDELGVTLATRNTRRLELTSEGRRVERIAEQILDAGAALFHNRADGAEVSGQVAVTVPVEVAQSWLPIQLERFKRKHQKVNVSISASDLVVDLSQSAFDMAIRARFLPPGVVEAAIDTLPLTCVSAEPMSLEPRDDHLFAPVTLLTHRTSDTLAVRDQTSSEIKGIQFRDVMTVDNKHVALAMVARGMGAALVTQNALTTWPDLSPCPPHMEFGHILLETEMRDKRPSEAALALKSMLAQTERTGAKE